MKRIWNKLIVFLTVMAMVCVSAFIISCADNNSTSNAPTVTADVVLNQTSISATIGDKTMVKVTNAYRFDKIEWSSSDESVAKVDQNGLVEAYGIGTAKIKATALNKSAECTITVGLGGTLPRIMIENEREEYRIGRDSTSFPFSVYVSFNGKTFNDVQVEYFSSDEQVVKIGDDASIQVVGSGQAEIILDATWRGLNFEDAPSLLKSVKVSVVDELYFYINGRQYSNIDLYTVNSFEGKTYTNEMNFVPSVEFNGQESSEVEVTLPENLLTLKDGKIVASGYGAGKIIMTYEKEGQTYSYSIDVTVTRPQEKYNKHLKYFSSFTGTFKDDEDGYQDKSIVKELFGSTDVENLKVYQGKKELTVKDGKVLDLNLAEVSAYNDTLRFETDEVIYTVGVTVYTLVVQSAEDLKHFDLKILNGDNPETFGYDETEVTFIDGYCELINNIDATGIKLTHSALNTEYDFVDASGATVKTTVNAERYNKEGGIRKYGFSGTFNGNGYTISNFDASVESGYIGGGLFGYMLGGAVVHDFAMTNVNITNSSAITYGNNVPAPIGGKDSLGIKREYTTYKNIYISLSEDTTNPQGAIMYKARDHWMGLYEFSNIIVDGSGVTANDSVSGGILTGNAELIYKASTYVTRNNIYVISNEYPISKSSTVTVYGENQANGQTLNTVIDDKAYSSGIKGYKTISDLIAAGNDYSAFSDSWNVSDYPVFKTAFSVLPEYDGNYVYDAVIVVSSATDGKQLRLVDMATGGGINYQVSGADAQKVIVEDGFIKLKDEVLEEQAFNIVLSYELDGKSNVLEITVRAVPSNVIINDQVVMSAYSGKIELEKYFEKGEKVISAEQVFASGNSPLTVETDGTIKGVNVKIKSDYSDVENVTLKVTTNVTSYTLTAVKAYSHIIKEASDLNVLKRTSGASRTTGYYILANNIDMKGTGIDHSEIAAGDTTNVFQGVFDGQGYTIIDFKPTHYGLFGSVYSDTEDNGGKSIIRNVGFAGVISPERLHSASDGGFTILGRYVNSVQNGVVVEVTNVHVNIRNTYLSAFSPAPNYHGLFESNSAEKSNVFNNFKMTNVYVEIDNEEYQNIVGWYHGTILSRDHLIVSSTVDSRSARFDNVVTVSKASPLVYRAWDGTGVATAWGIHMYFVYAENDVGKEGLSYKAETSPHNPIDYGKEADGCYIYKNVYRYDTAEQAATAKQAGFIDTGLWQVKDGKLVWKSAPFKATPDGESGNFNPDWFEELLPEEPQEEIDRESANFNPEWFN